MKAFWYEKLYEPISVNKEIIAFTFKVQTVKRHTLMKKNIYI